MSQYLDGGKWTTISKAYEEEVREQRWTEIKNVPANIPEELAPRYSSVILVYPYLRIISNAVTNWSSCIGVESKFENLYLRP